jgi:hypothetical protein
MLHSAPQVLHMQPALLLLLLPLLLSAAAERTPTSRRAIPANTLEKTTNTHPTRAA